MEALAPPQWAERLRREGITLNHMVGEHPLSHHESSRPVESQSTGALSEYQGVQRADLNIPLARETSARVGVVDSDSDDDFQDSREALPTRSMADPITITRVPQSTTLRTTQLPSLDLTRHQEEQPESGGSPQTPGSEEGTNASHVANLLEDVKYFHNAALGYQDAYEALQQQQEELQSKFTEQAKLIKEASETLKAVEAESSMRQQEIEALQSQREADIQHAIGQAMLEYRDQLSLAQNDLQQKDREHQQSIQRLQDQVCALELSLAGQATLPSVAASSSRAGLCQEVFNVLPGTVNQHREAAQYESQDQAFSFYKQVRFEDNDSSPKLRPEVKSGGGRSALSLPVILPRLSDISGISHAPPKFSSTPIALH